MSTMLFRSRRLGLLVLLAVFAAGFIVVLPVSVGRFGKSSVDDLRGRLVACRTNECVVEVLFEGLASLGPGKVLGVYGSLSPNSGGAIDCHDATHRLGERAFVDFGVAAWVPGGGICNFGYYHGFLVGASAATETEDFETLAYMLCEEKALPESDLPGSECAHGFGHAVYHLSGSLPEASARCAAFGGGVYRRRCTEGAVKDVLSRQPFVTERDFAACDGIVATDRGACVYVTAAYAVVRTNNIGSVSEVCNLHSSGEMRRECEGGLGRGVSMRAVGERFREPGRWALEVCGTSSLCGFGFGRSMYFIRYDEDWSLKECARLVPGPRAGCEDGVREGRIQHKG